MKLVFLPFNRINLVKTKIIIKAYYHKKLSYSLPRRHAAPADHAVFAAIAEEIKTDRIKEN